MGIAPPRLRDACRDRTVLAVLCLALLARLFVFAINHPFAPLDKDDSVYDQLATNVLEGHGFSISTSAPYEPLGVRSPGYPAFLAAVYAVAGHETDAVRAVQILLSLGTCLIVYLLGQALVGRRGGILAAAIYATMPAAIGYPTEILTEANEGLFIVGAVYAVYRSREEESSNWWPIAAAVWLGLATLARPDYQFLIVFLFAALLFMVGRWRTAAVRTALAMACFAALLVPVMMWNYARFDRFIGLASGTGYVLLSAQLEAEGKTGRQLYAEFERRYGAAFEAAHHRKMTLLDNARPEEDPARMRDFVAILKTEPDEYLKHSVRRLAALWAPRSWSDALRLDKDFSEYAAAKDYGRIIAKILLLAWDAAVMGLAAIGGLLALKRWREFAPVIGVVLYASLI